MITTKKEEGFLKRFFSQAKEVPRDGYILFTTRFLRLFSYGCMSVVLFLYLKEVGINDEKVGALFTCTLIGDLIISLYLTTHADEKIGRKRTLLISAVLKILAGVVFGITGDFVILLLAGIFGVITPSGGEIGPFLPIEQSALSQLMEDKNKFTLIFAWYNLFGYIAAALGALISGAIVQVLQDNGTSIVNSYRTIIFLYSFFGFAKLILYAFLSSKIEPTITAKIEGKGFFSRFGLHNPESKKIVAKLSGLFMLDAFAGGFVMQTIIVLWFKEKWGLSSDLLGTMIMAANVLSGISSLAAAPLAEKIGLVNTMVFTHLPSNVFLILVPLMPNKILAVVVLLFRFCISQMDVPTRQSYTASSVQPEERSAAGGITNIVRSVGLSTAPLLAGYLLKNPKSIWYSFPFFIAGGLKIVYDLWLYFALRISSSSKPTSDVKKLLHEDEADPEEQNKFLIEEEEKK